MPKTLIQSIQVLRGIAAMMVVFHHVTGNMAKVYNIEFLHRPFQIGFAGVDLFFVISGFIIFYTSQTYINRPAFLMEYFRRRCVRVFPIYWIFTGILLCIAFLLQKQFSLGYEFTLSNILQTLLLTPYHFAINAVSWTLSYELFFYLMFAFVILSRYAVVVPLIVLCLSTYNIFTGYWGTGLLNHTDFYFYVSPFNFEFLMGGLIFLLYRRVRISLSVCFMMLAIAILIVFVKGYSVLDDVTNHRVGVFGTASVLIVWGVVRWEYLQGWKALRGLLLLGDASYMIYLIHFPIIILANKILVKTVGLNIVSMGINLLLLLAIPLLGIFLHKRIEKPLLKTLSWR
jgi:exopolysaccharide production protein ExoZ